MRRRRLVRLRRNACPHHHERQLVRRRQSPLDTNLESTDLGSKTGTSEASSVLGLFAWGDAGTQAAAKDGGIKIIEHADQEHFSILGIVYARYRTVVYGD